MKHFELPIIWINLTMLLEEEVLLLSGDLTVGFVLKNEQQGLIVEMSPYAIAKFERRKLLKFGSANTSVSTGIFSITKDFRGSVNYSLEFETAGHKVTDFFGFSVCQSQRSKK